jgi:hypothetical protein
MNRILMVVMMFVIPLIFTLKVNGQVVSSELTKTEINQLFKTVPLEKIDKYGVPVKEPKFSASVGIGINYGFGDEKHGRIDSIKSISAPRSLKIGYSPIKYLEIQSEYSAGSSFKGVTSLPPIIERITDVFSFTAFTMNIKAGVPVTIKDINFYPYIVLGAGRANMTFSDKLDWPSQGLYYSADIDKSSGSCFKSGIGAEVKISKSAFAFSELSRWEVKWKRPWGEATWIYSQALFGLGIKF